MNYGVIHILDTANGPGLRVTLFVSGCTHHCEGCFNPETWDFNYGKEYTPRTESYILSVLGNPCIDGLTILGGEPMEPVNQKEIRHLVKRVRDLHKTVWIYTGYQFEDLIDSTNKRCHCEYTNHILANTHVLVDGEFMKDKKDLRLQFRGSSNQRIIDVPKSLEHGTVYLKEGFK